MYKGCFTVILKLRIRAPRLLLVHTHITTQLNTQEHMTVLYYHGHIKLVSGENTGAATEGKLHQA